MSQVQPPEEERSAPRLHVPVGVSVSLILATKQSVFVNLRNVSEKGACVLRQGTLEIKEDDQVFFVVRDYDSGLDIRLLCTVRWLRATGFSTYVGLSFINGTLSQDSLTRLAT